MFEVEDGEEAPKSEEAGRKNVVRKNVQPKKVGKVGEVAHYHKAENETEEWDEPCHYVSHKIRNQGGFSINEVRYSGTVIVPSCFADYLAWMEVTRKQYEQGIFRSTKLNKVVGSY
jgi:hypothetical protein